MAAPHVEEGLVQRSQAVDLIHRLEEINLFLFTNKLTNKQQQLAFFSLNILQLLLLRIKKGKYTHTKKKINSAPKSKFN